MRNEIDLAHKAILSDEGRNQLLREKADIISKYGKQTAVIEEDKEVSITTSYSESVQKRLDYIDEMIITRTNAIKNFYNIHI